MLFTEDGPDIPAEVLEAQEDGTLVLFCGAGISVPAGLPLFKGLVEKVCEQLGDATTSQPHRQDLQKGYYDRIIARLEKEYGRPKVREELVACLSLRKDAKLDMHRHVLALAKTRGDKFRLVTTNVDRAFQRLRDETGFALDVGPKLPVPKPHKWNSVVHLHGMIDADTDPDGESLVMSSGDFGAAYLAEGWAARFATELFRHYTVLFVGYSLDDPVIRYLVDAQAADRDYGMPERKHFALASFSPAKRRRKEDVKQEWRARNVEPILFNERHSFVLLRRTLKNWATTYKLGLRGRLETVRKFGRQGPEPLLGGDEGQRARQFLWALREEEDGIPRAAIALADLDPPAAVEWLGVFERAGSFRLADPSPKDANASPVPLHECPWDQPRPLAPVARQLCRWLAKHMAHPKVIAWALKSGAYLHPEAKDAFQSGLGRLDIEPPALLTFWQIVTSENHTRPSRNPHASWAAMDAWSKTPSPCPQLVKHELLLYLTPYLSLKPPFRLGRSGRQDEEEERYIREATSLRDIAEPEVRLAVGHNAVGFAHGVLKLGVVNTLLPDLVDPLTSLLEKVFDLFSVCSEAGSDEDHSWRHQPPIVPDPQNGHSEEWTILVVFLCAAFDALAKVSPSKAKLSVERWRSIDYPIFKRFALRALAKEAHYSLKDGVDFLVTEGDGRWLWSNCTGREMQLLLESILARLDRRNEEDLARVEELVQKVIDGPPGRDTAGSPEEDLAGYGQRRIWALLTRIEQLSDGALPEAGAATLSELREANPGWVLSDFEKTGVLVSVHRTRGEGNGAYTPEHLLSLSVSDLVAVFRGNWQEANHAWGQVVQADPQKAVEVLNHLCNERLFGDSPWRATISNLKPAAASADQSRKLAGIFLQLREPLLGKLVRSLAFWIQEWAQHAGLDVGPRFLDLWDLLQEAAGGGDAPPQMGDAVNTALNSPAGILTEALLQWGWSGEPSAGQTLVVACPKLVPRPTRLAGGNGASHTYARIILGMWLQPLYAVDPDWTGAHLLTRLRWRDGDACDLWLGFLANCRHSLDLLAAMRDALMQAPEHLAELEGMKENFLNLVAAICLDYGNLFDRRRLLASLDADALAMVARGIRMFLDDSELAEDAWSEEVHPVLRLWPQATNAASGEAALHLSFILVRAGKHFPKAFKDIRHVLRPITDYELNRLIRKIDKIKFATMFPVSTLEMLGKIIDVRDAPDLDDTTLRRVLDDIVQADLTLETNLTYRALDEFLITRGL